MPEEKMPEQNRTLLTGNELGLDVNAPDRFQIIVDFPDTGMPIAPAAQEGIPQPAGAAMPPPAAMPRSVQEIETRSRSAISAAMNTIREMALQTDAMLDEIPGGAQPRMIRVKFGVQLDFQIGAILAKSGAGATLEVELEWARRSDDVLRVTELGEGE